MRTAGWPARIRRAASIPLTLGIRTSMSTRSGCRAAACSIASMPSRASPTTEMSGEERNTCNSPCRNSAWSSTTSTRTTCVSSPTTSTTSRIPWVSARDFDEAERPVATPVQHRRVVRLRVTEQEEVVAEQLHLQRGLLGRHRLDRELLGLHDRRSGVVVVLDVVDLAEAV